MNRVTERRPYCCIVVCGITCAALLFHTFLPRIPSLAPYVHSQPLFPLLVMQPVQPLV